MDLSLFLKVRTGEEQTQPQLCGNVSRDRILQ